MYESYTLYTRVQVHTCNTSQKYIYISNLLEMENKNTEKYTSANNTCTGTGVPYYIK